MAKLFYVYTLSYKGKIFYVGKGSGNRINQHEYEAKNGAKTSNCDKIRQIQKSGGQIGKTIWHKTHNELEALKLETIMLLEFGLDNLTNSILTNQYRFGFVPKPVNSDKRDIIQVKVSLTEDEYYYIKQIADETGKSFSNVLREMILPRIPRGRKAKVKS